MTDLVPSALGLVCVAHVVHSCDGDPPLHEPFNKRSTVKTNIISSHAFKGKIYHTVYVEVLRSNILLLTPPTPR